MQIGAHDNQKNSVLEVFEIWRMPFSMLYRLIKMTMITREKNFLHIY